MATARCSRFARARARSRHASKRAGVRDPARRHVWFQAVPCVASSESRSAAHALRTIPTTTIYTLRPVHLPSVLGAIELPGAAAVASPLARLPGPGSPATLDPQPWPWPLNNLSYCTLHGETTRIYGVW